MIARKIVLKSKCTACDSPQINTFDIDEDIESLKKKPHRFYTMCKECENVFYPIRKGTFTEIDA